MAEDARNLDIYLRFNEDEEHDYCFSVPNDATVSHLFDILATIPVVSAPSLMYYRDPVGFIVSRQPGILTPVGSVLFNENKSAVYSNNIKLLNENSKIKDIAFKGQLFLPVWKKNHRFNISIIILFLCWLYTDLPDYISPTPGISLSTLIISVAEKIFSIPPEEDAYSHKAQWIFFTIHIFKLIFCYLFLWLGIYNPNKFPLLPSFISPGSTRQNFDVDHEKLEKIGWTGAHRATPSEWFEHYRKFKVDSAGGNVLAFQKGVLQQLKDFGVKLGPGEGWDSPLEPDFDALNDESKWILTKDRYSPEELSFYEHLQNSKESPMEKWRLLRQWRRYGPLTASSETTEKYSNRKKYGDADEKKKSQ